VGIDAAKSEQSHGQHEGSSPRGMWNKYIARPAGHSYRPAVEDGPTPAPASNCVDLEAPVVVRARR
jgi:hypothetical protein